MPQRIQRKRTKGWRMPEGAVYVGRPTIWGNPFAVDHHGAEKALVYYRAFCLGEFVPEAAKDYRRGERDFYNAGAPIPDGLASLYPADLARIILRGKDLACWCPIGRPCHADVLLELANVAVPDAAESWSIASAARRCPTKTDR